MPGPCVRRAPSPAPPPRHSTLPPMFRTTCVGAQEASRSQGGGQSASASFLRCGWSAFGQQSAGEGASGSHGEVRRLKTVGGRVCRPPPPSPFDSLIAACCPSEIRDTISALSTDARSTLALRRRDSGQPLRPRLSEFLWRDHVAGRPRAALIMAILLLLFPPLPPPPPLP